MLSGIFVLFGCLSSSLKRFLKPSKRQLRAPLLVYISEKGLRAVFALVSIVEAVVRYKTTYIAIAIRLSSTIVAFTWYDCSDLPHGWSKLCSCVRW